MFIVKKNIKGGEYYYLNENKRVEGKVKTKSLAYLGKNKKEAIKKAKEIMDSMEKETEKEAIIPNEPKKEIKVGKKIDEINKIAASRGFFFQTAEVYGGNAGFYTYGHLGKLLKSNWENLWRKHFLSLDDNFHEIQSNNILPEAVFKASGHLENFNDPMTECKKCRFRFRADQFLEDNGVEEAEKLSIEEMGDILREKKLKCPKCGGELGEVKQFNMMFAVNVGFNDEKSYLSPETAQGAYITFLNEFKATREKLPLGLAIIDKAYRNEISPRQMFFRLREFSQAELQIFFDSSKIEEHGKWKDVAKKILRVKLANEKNIGEKSCENLNQEGIPKFYLYYLAKVQEFYLNILMIPKEKFRFRELSKEERAFYNKIHFDVEIDLETFGGFKEVGGVHYRGDHDLIGHSKVSGKNFEVFYDGKKVLPHVLELSFGIDRNIWTLLDTFYRVGKDGSMFSFPTIVSPIKAAVFPIVKREDFERIADEVVLDLGKDWKVVYDKGGSIGRRYARNDEIGTPFCVTIDEESLKRKDVTVRERDTTKQIRIKIADLKNSLKKIVDGDLDFEKAGKIFK
ncbi:MAG: glycine--tRNA ligase [Nanoarchaeota archaeon]